MKWAPVNDDGYLNFHSISGDGRVSNWTLVKVPHIFKLWLRIAMYSLVLTLGEARGGARMWVQQLGERMKRLGDGAKRWLWRDAG